MKKVKISLMTGMMILSIASFAQNKKHVSPPPPPEKPTSPPPPPPKMRNGKPWPKTKSDKVVFTPPKIVKDVQAPPAKPKKPLPPPPPPKEDD